MNFSTVKVKRNPPWPLAIGLKGELALQLMTDGYAHRVTHGAGRVRQTA